MFGIDELKEVIPFPVLPHGAPDDTQWLQIFGGLGTRLPLDYVLMRKAFGAGHFFSISHKFSANLSLYEMGPQGAPNQFSAFGRLNELRIKKEQSSKAVPFPLYYEPQGLLPWGRLTNEADICWRVSGHLVDDWTTVVIRPSSREHEVFEMSAVQFLARALSGKVVSALLPTGFPGKKGVAFQPSGHPAPPAVVQYGKSL